MAENDKAEKPKRDLVEILGKEVRALRSIYTPEKEETE